MITEEVARSAAGYTDSDVNRFVLVEWAIQELTRREAERAQPITAEWCRENGAKVHKHAFTRDGKRYWGACWIVANVVIVVYGGEYVHINGCEVARKLSRPELLAIVTALKGGAT